MIIVDRVLTEDERREIGSRESVDLTGVSVRLDHRQAVFSNVVKWLDEAESHTIDGQSYDEFFQFRGKSYWLHVRARLFHQIWSHAQFMVRLRSIHDVASIERIYCDQTSDRFWRITSPNVELRIVRSPRQKVAGISTVSGLALRVPSAIRASSVWSGGRPEGIVFSMSRHNRKVDGGLDDAEVGPLLDEGKGQWQRLEYQPLPKQDLEAPPEYELEGRRLHNTLTSTDALVAYLSKHPFDAGRSVKAFKELRSRFIGPHRFSFSFEQHDDELKQTLSSSIRLVAPSIALLDAYYRSFRWLLTRSDPRFVFATCENNGAGRTFIDAARDLNIISFGVQHGLIGPHNIDYRLSRIEAEKGYPDHFFTWGEAPRDFLIRRSHYDSARVHSVGQPSFDRIFPKPDLQIEQLARKTQRPVLLFASQPQPNQRNRIEAAYLLADFCRRNELACVVRLHPAERDDGLYDRVFAEQDISDQLELGSGQLHDQIIAADFGGTCYSTVSWEMMALGLPLAVFDPSGSDLLQLMDEPCVLQVPSPTDVERQWLAEKDSNAIASRKIAEKYVGPRDRQTSRRIADLIRRYAGLTSLE